MKFLSNFFDWLQLAPLRLVELFAAAYCRFLVANKYRYAWIDRQVNNSKNLVRDITHRSANGTDVLIRLYIPNKLCRFRAKTFSIKEPETLEWIDKYGGEGILFDIGSNIGLYSIYYALTKKGRVYSFEPSVFNLSILTKNIHTNNVSEKVRIVTNPLTETTQFAKFSFTKIYEGAALAAFGVDYGHQGTRINEKFNYHTLGFSIDYLFDCGALKEYPKIIKIDVDGIEHLIISGAKNSLKNTACKIVIVEVNSKFESQYACIKKLLEECGFILKDEKNSKLFQHGGTSRQLWLKSEIM